MKKQVYDERALRNSQAPQAQLFLAFLKAVGMPLEKILAAWNTGCLKDFLGSENLATIDRVALRKILGYDPNIFPIQMGGDFTADEVRKMRFPVDEIIDREHFPVVPRKTLWEDEIKLIDPGNGFSGEEGSQIIADKKLLLPTYEHALRFVSQYGKTTTSKNKSGIVFLYKDWHAPFCRNHRRALFLNLYPGCRSFSLTSLNGFASDCVLAGVVPRKKRSIPLS